MELKELLRYDPITIQCHDNPDADAIASGYGLYLYFCSKGKECRLIYSGRNEIQKSNLVLMLRELNIPISYIPADRMQVPVKGLLITVDCQYGAGNVTRFEAENTAIIDHHQIEITNVPLSEIRPGLGSCATLIWQMLKDEGFEINNDQNLGTALYYGLYTDTNQFAELYNPLDMDAVDGLPHDQYMITYFKNCNISLKELDIAGLAMLRYSYNEDYRFAVVHSQACDPNILGLISDFLLQVDCFGCCVVFAENGDGFKYSVRSCVREVNAGELAAYLGEGIGSGGGHYEKAGGFIKKSRFEETYKGQHADVYFNNRMVQYFNDFDLVYAEKYEADTSRMKCYVKKDLPIGFCRAKDILPNGSAITVRTIEGDMDLTITDDLYIMIGIRGEVYPIREEKFNISYTILEGEYVFDECVIEPQYEPTFKNRITGEVYKLTAFAHKCMAKSSGRIYAGRLERGVKVFTAWDKNRYMLGKKGDYLAVRVDDVHDIYVIEGKIFDLTYREV